MMGGESAKPRAKSQDSQEQPTQLHAPLQQLQATLTTQRLQQKQRLYDKVTSNLDNALPQMTMTTMLYNEADNN